MPQQQQQQQHIERLREELRRQDARLNLLDFVRYTMPEFESSDHHGLICGELERIYSGETTRLMLLCPPRHTKSELATRRFPAWWLGHRPSDQIISVSYNQDLSTDFGRAVRGILQSEDYGRLFDTRLDPDATAANRWATAQGGQYAAVGVGGPITGRGANLAIIDDPVKDRVEADSPAFQSRNYAWYTSTLYTRLMPGGAIILIMTRWNLRDLAGLLLADQENGTGDDWRIVSLPAIATAGDPLGRSVGEALWPEWYSATRLAEIKTVLPLRDWTALYQQTPTEETGTFFKREWLRYYDASGLDRISATA